MKNDILFYYLLIFLLEDCQMDIKVKKSKDRTTVVFESSNREFNFQEVEGDAISTNEKMTFTDIIKSLYLAGKNNDAVFIETENE
jgi:hypothetical protein